MRSHSYVVNSSHNNNKHPTQHKSINKIILNNKYINMVKYGDIVDGDLTEYEYSDSECSESSVDETEEDDIQTNQYIRKCNMARTVFTEKKRRAALLRAKASEKSFGSEVCDSTNDSANEEKASHDLGHTHTNGSEVCDSTNDSASEEKASRDLGHTHTHTHNQNHIDEYSDEFSQEDYEPINEKVDDSMSCVYGRVNNGRGDDSFLGIVTDTGSGLPIINARYAEGLGLEFLPLSDDQAFEINGAGGGKEKVRY